MGKIREEELKKDIQYLITYAEEHFGSSRYREVSIVEYSGLFRRRHSVIVNVGDGRSYIRSEYSPREFGYHSIELLKEVIEAKLDLI